MPTTDYELAAYLATQYPNANAPLQKLIMAAEKCHKSIGKTTLFGKDKFAPALDVFNAAYRTCIQALERDGHLHRLWNTAAEEALAVNEAMEAFSDAYPNWPRAYKFWGMMFQAFISDLPEVPDEPSPALLDWLEARESSVKAKQAFAAQGGHMMLRPGAYDPRKLPEPLRTEAIMYLKEREDREG